MIRIRWYIEHGSFSGVRCERVLALVMAHRYGFPGVPSNIGNVSVNFLRVVDTFVNCKSPEVGARDGHAEIKTGPTS